MKKIIVRIGVLLLVFLASVSVTTLLMNSENTNNVGDLNPASLPEVMMEMDGLLINRMYGNRQEMEVATFRDSITPLETAREITIVVKPHEQKITELSYEIKSSDGQVVLENQTVKNLRTEDGCQKATVSFTTESMKMNQEYSFCIRLTVKEEPVYYYTRIVQRSRLNAGRYVEFVQSFSQKCLNKSASSELLSYVEPDGNSSTDFTKVNIHSSVDMITWGSLAPQISRAGIPSIVDINETTGSLRLDYQVTAKDGDGNRELYEVSEFYRMRYTQSKVMLLDFQRKAKQVFDGNLPVVDSQGILLGIADRDLQYVSNPGEDYVAFVQNGDLWSYNQSTSKSVKIFSFRADSDSDERYDHGEHDMKILRLSASGDIDFVLYGYMNRGPHEGYVGISVCHYSSVQNAVEEKVFVPSTLSYEFLSLDMKKLAYVNDDDQLFFLAGSRLYQVDIPNRSYQIIQDYIDEESFVASLDQSRAAWAVDEEGYHAGSITEINFENEKTRVLSAGANDYIRALGFMNEDLIYGYAARNLVTVNASGEVHFPMYQIKIENFDGTVKKEYKKEGLYVTQVAVSESLMKMELSEIVNGRYVYKTSENIMNNKRAVEQNVDLNVKYTQRRGPILRLDFEKKISNPQPITAAARMKALEQTNILDMGLEYAGDELYYVYAYGELDSLWTEPAKAIIRADEMVGVVLNSAQQYVWERGNKKTKIRLDASQLPEMVRAGVLDKVKLQDALEGTATVMDLTGCSLESVLYEVSMQRPVIASMGNGKSVVIVGYDEYNTLVYTPEDGKVSYMGMQDSTNAFKNAGNVFLSYVEK